MKHVTLVYIIFVVLVVSFTPPSQHCSALHTYVYTFLTIIVYNTIDTLFRIHIQIF